MSTLALRGLDFLSAGSESRIPAKKKVRSVAAQKTQTRIPATRRTDRNSNAGEAVSDSPVQPVSSGQAPPRSNELLQQLVADHQADVWRYLRALGCPGDIADDLTQETFIVAFRRPFDYYGPRAAASYLRRTAYHRYLSFVQQSKKNSHVDLDVVEVAQETMSRWCERQRSGGEIMDVLRDCMADLPERSRYVLELRYRDGLSRQEIAKQLSLTEHGAKNLLQRAKKRLRVAVECQITQRGKGTSRAACLTP